MDSRSKELVLEATKARARAHAPYSQFAVGAAVRDTAGGIHRGVNVENVSYGLTICAERNAVARAIADGSKEFEAIAIVAEGERPLAPCGACRQVLLEFAPKIRVIMANTAGAVEELSLEDLLPAAFTNFKANDAP